MKNSTKMVMALMIRLLAVLMIGCKPGGNEIEERIVLNKGTTVVENGRGLYDTIPYTCIGCAEYLTFEMFEKVKNESSEIVKNNLINPLSFIPLSMDIFIIQEDSLYDFETNNRIDSVLSVITTYKFIGQNAFGAEIRGEQLITFHLVNGVVKDISESIKLEDLKFEDEFINRTLSLFDNNNFIQIIPTKDKGLIVKSSISCVDEGTRLIINLLNGDEIRLVSWNDFNCDGTSYFYWFSRRQIEKLKSSKIESILVIDDQSVGILVPKNNSDYFIQLLNLFN